jgi:hypothetical protein
MRRDWEVVRDNVMREAVEAKMTQHNDVRDVLLSTHGAAIVESTANDQYWGDGDDGTGRNMLGILLMELRNKLASAKHPQFLLVPPWLRYPGISHGDMLYRMGQGEDDLCKWYKWRETLSALALYHYDNYYPAPAWWRR